MSSPLATVAGKYSCCRAGYCHDLPEWHALMFSDPEIQQGDHDHIQNFYAAMENE